MPHIDVITQIGLAAGFLHLAGYFVYLRHSDIEPNPVTWLMFAYGTSLLTLLEWDSDASFAELFLPAVCSAMAVWVAFRCWHRARARDATRLFPRWPQDWRDRTAFQIDLVLTAFYLAAALMLHTDVIAAQSKDAVVLIFLTAANLTTYSAFFPLLRSVSENPRGERIEPWVIWCGAYSLLGLTTYLHQGEFFTVLIMYPVQSAVLHGLVAYLARPSRRARYAALAPAG